MTNTFDKIQTVTVGSGGAANIEFTSIPGTYTDLKIFGSTRSGSSSGNQLALRFNSDTGSNYSRKLLYGDGSSVQSFSGTSETYARFAFTQSSTFTASVFNNFVIYIPNYATSLTKVAGAEGVTENNATQAEASLHGITWNSSAAITIITLLDSGSTNFAQYSSATLYGIKNT